VMIKFAEFGRANARDRRINFHKIAGSRRLVGGDYGPKCASCRDTGPFWSGAAPL